jgi:hypothetical protein
MPARSTVRVTLSAFFVGMAAAGCVQVSTGPEDPTGDAETPTTAAGGSDDGGTTGTSCGTDPQTGTVLCLGVAACPSTSVDPAAWPSCGFRVTGGSTLDLECLCSGSLCPIGVATTCEQAAGLLSAQTQLMVCEQVSENRCVSLATPSSGQGGSEAGTSSTCNQSCLVGCGTAADCLQLCGC